MLIVAYLGKLNVAFHMVTITITTRRYILDLCLTQVVGSECSLSLKDCLYTNPIRNSLAAVPCLIANGTTPPFTPPNYLFDPICTLYIAVSCMSSTDYPPRSMLRPHDCSCCLWYSTNAGVPASSFSNLGVVAPIDFGCICSSASSLDTTDHTWSSDKGC